MTLTPLTLVDLCLDACTDIIESDIHQGGGAKWIETVFLHEQVCEGLLEKIRCTHDGFHDEFLNVFANPETCRLIRVNLSGTKVTEEGLEKISWHLLRELNVANCKYVKEISNVQGRCQKSLLALNVSGCKKIRDLEVIVNFTNLQTLDLSKTDLPQITFSRIFQNGFPKLTTLNVACSRHLQNVNALEHNFPSLTSLDVSETDIGSIRPLRGVARTLQWLSLYKCLGISHVGDLAEELGYLVNLQYLDLSKSVETSYCRGESDLGHPVIDAKTLKGFVSKMPKLRVLDLSGTLACNESSDLDFLRQRPEPLDILGLLFTEACVFPNLPAQMVTGDANIEQIMSSLDFYKNTRIQFSRLLVKDIATYATVCQRMDRKRAAKLIAELSFIYPTDSYLQLQVSVAAFYILKEDQNISEISGPLVRAVINSIESNPNHEQLIKNLCLTLCCLDIPSDLLFDYERIMNLLFDVALRHPEDQVQRITISLCNCMVCQVDNEQKKAVGRIGGIEKILKLVRKKVTMRERGATLSVCWSCLWNVTDETPENCERFIHGGGLGLMLICHQEFPFDIELTRNMLGLLGNVAEVQYLRFHLMTEETISMLYNLLRPLPHGELEIAYNVSGIFSHLASDGEQAWTVQSPSKQDALSEVVKAVDSWDIKTERHMSYRSFEPILRLLPHFGSPEIQYWATWALANLCYIDSSKYCPMLIQEEGVPLLEAILDDENSKMKIKDLVKICLSLCRQTIRIVENGEEEEYSSDTNMLENSCDESSTFTAR